MKNANTANDSSSTWTAWATSSTRTRLTFSSPHLGLGPRSAPSSRPRAAAARAACRGSAATSAAVELVVDPVDLLGQPHQQEADRDGAEQQHGQPHHPAVEGRGDLPDLGVDEQERDEQQQQRQRPGRQREQQPEAPEGPADRPARDRPARSAGSA